MGHDNVTFEGGLVIFVCQVPWSPGKVPSTPAVLRAPFSAGVAPFFPKSYAHLRMVTPFTEGVTPFADGLRSFPRDFQGLGRPTPLPRVGSAWFTALRAGPDLLSSIGGGVGGSHHRTRRFGVVCIT